MVSKNSKTPRSIIWQWLSSFFGSFFVLLQLSHPRRDCRLVDNHTLLFIIGRHLIKLLDTHTSLFITGWWLKCILKRTKEVPFICKLWGIGIPIIIKAMIVSHNTHTFITDIHISTWYERVLTWCEQVWILLDVKQSKLNPKSKCSKLNNICDSK